MLSLLGVLFFLIYYLFTYFYCNSINVVYSKEISIDVSPLINLKGKIFMFRLKTNDSDIMDPSYGQTVPYLYIENKGKVEYKKINKGKCQDFPILSHVDYNNYECLDQNQNLTILYNRTENVHIYLNIFIEKCKNDSSTSIICKQEEEIEKYLLEHDISFDYYVETNFADHNNRTNPIMSTYSYNNLKVDYNGHFNYIFFQNWKMMTYESDNGIVIQNIQKYNTFVFDWEGIKELIYPINNEIL